MAEATGTEIGKVGIKDRIKSFVGLKPKTSPQLPVSNTPQSSAELQQMVSGISDPATGEVRGPDASWRGPGVGQNDRRILGEERATSPGAEILKTGSPTSETETSQPTYIAQGTELDNQPLASATQPEPTPSTQETPPNVVNFPPQSAEPTTPTTQPTEAEVA